MARVRGLPLSNLGSGFIFLRSAHQRRSERRQLLEDLLFQNRAYIGACCEVGFSPGVAALAAHVDEIGKRLGTRSSLVKVSALPAEGIRRDYALGLELIVTHGTTELDLTQRCHGTPPVLSSAPWKWRRNICAILRRCRPSTPEKSLEEIQNHSRYRPC